MADPGGMIMKSVGRVLVLAVALIASRGLSACAAADSPEARAIDQLLSAKFKPGEPGAAVLVTRKGQTVIRKGYGLADLEMKIPIEPDMVFRLGSVTKQFTAVAILMLEEQGKLSVKDPAHEVPARLPDARADHHDRAPPDPHVRHPELHVDAGVAVRCGARTSPLPS